MVAALERLLVESGLVGPDELAAGAASAPGKDVPGLAAAKVNTALRRGGPTTRPAHAAARFEVG